MHQASIERLRRFRAIAMVSLLALAACDNGDSEAPFGPTLGPAASATAGAFSGKTHTRQIDIQPPLAVHVEVVGPVRTGEPLRVVVSAAAHMDLTSSEVTVAMPQLEAARQSGFGDDYSLGGKGRLLQTAEWSLGSLPAGAELSRETTVTVPEAGIYQILVTARSTAAALGSPSTARASRWVRVGSESGETLNFYDPPQWPDEPGARLGPEPISREVRTRVVKADVFGGAFDWVTAAFSSNPITVSVKYYDDVTQSYSPATLATGFAERYTDDPPWQTLESHQSGLNGAGQFTVPCNGLQEWWIWARLTNPDAFDKVKYTVGEFAECGDFVEIEIPTDRYDLYQKFDQIVDDIEAHVTVGRSQIGYTVSEFGCGSAEEGTSNSCYLSIPALGTEEMRISQPALDAMNTWVFAHEFGHALHNAALGGMLQAEESCAVRQSVAQVTAAICAYQEGFASYLGVVGGLGQCPAPLCNFGDINNFDDFHDHAGGLEAWVEGNVAAFFHDLVDSQNETQPASGSPQAKDRTTYPMSYITAVFTTCQTKESGGSFQNDAAVDQLIWCLERAVDEDEREHHFSVRPDWTEILEFAPEPGNWNRSDIRCTWIRNVGVAPECVAAPPSSPPPSYPPLSVSLTGPTEVPDFEACQWQAFASGGAGGNQFQWSGALWGPGRPSLERSGNRARSPSR